ncbi:MAG: FKBP-type peptidyl-prolyl cis-trans isomerase [Elusimicrobia bacterium]|nr:FKBP-type peptidyl-prolyl cis-trans isomerase [Elusimicrobiota bacterium]
MTKFHALLLLPVLAGASFAGDPAPEKKPDAPAKTEAAKPETKPEAKPAAKTGGPQTEEQKTMYVLGMWLSQHVAMFQLTPAQFKFVEMGLKDSVTHQKPQVDPQPYLPKLQELADKKREAMAKKQEEMAQKEAGPEKEKAKAFIEKMSKEKDAQKTATGLIYIPMKEGKGASPKASDTVKVHYAGTLINGTEFDSSIKRGEPATFPLDHVIPCWTEGVQKLKVGGKAKLICPSEIAYGDRGAPPTIPAGATLIFEVELLDIVKADKDKKN